MRYGFTGRGKSGSLNLNMIAPSTVRKKKAYSANPFSVSKIRMLPKRIYTDDNTVLRTSALIGDSPSSKASSASSSSSSPLAAKEVILNVPS